MIGLSSLGTQLRAFNKAFTTEDTEKYREKATESLSFILCFSVSSVVKALDLFLVFVIAVLTCVICVPALNP